MVFLRRTLQLLSVAAVAANTVMVDLSQDLIRDTAAMETSPGAVAVAAAASADPLIRSTIVLENGSVVAEYYREGVDMDNPYQVWSVTKSFMSMLVGILVEEGDLSLDDTLGDIFEDEATWANVPNDTVDFRKNVTIREMITHTSGLVTPAAMSVNAMRQIMPLMTSEQIEQAYNASLYTGGVSGGGSSVGSSLSALDIGTKGDFQIVGTSQILAYVIQQRTGMTPRQQLAAKVMPHLGIQEGDYNWLETLDGVQFGFHGLELTAIHMAKFGQLYLQGGKSQLNQQVVPESWVNTSTSTYVMNSADSAFFTSDYGYGYLFWVPGPNSFCAFGMLGQDVCVDKITSRVMVQQRDRDPENKDATRTMNLGVNYVVGAVASDPNLSFMAPSTTTTTAMNAAGSTSSADTSSAMAAGALMGPILGAFMLHVV